MSKKNYIFLSYFNKLLLLFIFILFLFLYLTLFPNKTFSKILVKQNSDYFVFGKNYNKIQNLYYDFVVQRYFKINFAENESEINNIAILTDDFIISQTEPEIFGYNIKQNYYGVSLGQIIIFGQGACEGVNGILGLRLSKTFKNIFLFSLFDENKKTSPHTLVKYSKEGVDYFIDIHSINRIHFFSFENKNGIDNEVYKNRFNGYEKDFFEKGFIIKKFDLYSYFNSFLKKIIAIKDNKINAIFISNERDNIEPVSLTKQNKKILINKFIDARFEHIDGNLEKAYTIYSEIIETNCNFDFCKIVNILSLRKNSL